MPKGSTVETRTSELVEAFSARDADPAWLLCDRHTAESIAFTLLEQDGSRADLTYGELRERSERFAGVLMGLGVGRGDRVATLMQVTHIDQVLKAFPAVADALAASW